MEDKNKPTEGQRTERVDTRGPLFTYANHIEVGRTAFDVRLLFGEILQATEEKVSVQSRVQVTISWLQAKLLSRLLSQVVKAYEDANGPIRVPSIANLPEPFDPSKED